MNPGGNCPSWLESSVKLIDSIAIRTDLEALNSYQFRALRETQHTRWRRIIVFSSFLFARGNTRRQLPPFSLPPFHFSSKNVAMKCLRFLQCSLQERCPCFASSLSPEAMISSTRTRANVNGYTYYLDAIFRTQNVRGEQNGEASHSCDSVCPSCGYAMPFA